MADTNYIINGINIGRASANPFGWAAMRAGTSQLGGITKRITKVEVPGYDGYFQSPSTRTEQMLIFNIRSPREHVDTLMALLAHTGYDANFPTYGRIEVSTDSGKAAYYELVSAIPSSDRPSDNMVDVTATLSIPYGGWRDIATTETTTSITTNPQTVTTIGSGISLPIRDMDIFIQGNVGTMEINDSKGSFLRTTAAYAFVSGTGIYYQGATGRAFFATDASPWVSTGDAGHTIDASGGGFQMTPYFTATTPQTRSARLTVLSTLLTSVSLKVRWRGAYVLR